jgi:ribosomal protein S18 acetylase RimI-like enzyme
VENGMNTDQVEIRLGLLQRHQRQAVNLYYDTFARKLAPLVGARDRGIALVEKIIDPRQAVVALLQDMCVGVAGLQYNNQRFINPRLLAFVQELGWWRGLPGCIAYRFFDSSPRNSELQIECLAVLPAMRGKGIGTLLLSAIAHHAKATGFSAMCLEVIDSNPEARRLYERQGFVPTRTLHYPYLRRIAGFSASTLMSKKIT